MIRQFQLSNEYGQSFTLNNVKTGFFHNPTGLGYTLDYSYEKLGPAWIPNYIKDSQKEISGTLVFYDTDPYQAQQGFLKFIRTSKNLVLRYTTTASTLNKDVDLVDYELTEIAEGGVLTCPIKLMPKSLWYSVVADQASLGNNDGIYYGYYWDENTVFNDYSDGYIPIVNDGSVDAAWSIDFYGPILNPKIYLELDDVPTHSVVIDAEISLGDMISYQCKDGKGTTYCVSGLAEDVSTFKRTGNMDAVDNLALNFDIANSNFFKLPMGGSRLHITADSPLTHPVLLNVYKYYRAR